MSTITFQFQYKNQNGLQNFEGATYRILKGDNKTVLVDKSVADKYGRTKEINLKKGEMIYIQLFNKNKKIYESPYAASPHVYHIGKGVDEVLKIVVTRTYFQIRLSDIKWRDMNGWKYVTKFGTVKVSGVINGGKSTYIDSTQLSLTDKKKEEIFLKEYNNVPASASPMVSISVIDPKNNREYTKHERLIPVGSKHEFRDFNIQQISSMTEKIESNSSVNVLAKVDYKPFMLSINETKGALYDVRLDNNQVFYDSSWARLTSKKVSDGKPEQLFLPYSYKGNIIIKNNKGKVIGLVQTVKSSHSQYAGPLIYSKEKMNAFKLTAQDAKSGLVSFSSNEDIKKYVKEMTENNPNWRLMEEVSNNRMVAYVMEIKNHSSIEEKDYSASDYLNMPLAACRHFTYEVLSSFVFDAALYPAAVYTAENFFYSQENRKLILSSILIPLMEGRGKDGKVHQLKFRLKRSNTGKLLLIFQGRAIWKKYMNVVTIGANHRKVSMVGGLYEIAHDLKASIKSSPLTGTLKASGRVVTTAVKGSPFGLVLVAAADTLEWLLDDNPEKKLSDLLGQLITDFGKSIIAGIAGVIAGVALGLTAAPAIAVIATGAIVMVVASFALEWLDSKGWLTNGVPWNQIAKEKTAAIWDAIQSKISSYCIDVSKTISNENQEFKFEPLV